MVYARERNHTQHGTPPDSGEVADVMDDGRTRQTYERAHDPSRVLALSDGVFYLLPLCVLPFGRP